MDGRRRWQRWRRMVLACLLAWGVAAGEGWLSESYAATIYSYTDERGNPVYTDKPETIPERYRASAKVHELSDPDSKKSSVLQSVQQTIKNRLKAIGSKTHVDAVETGVRNLDQDAIINYAGMAAVLLLLIMYFSKNSPMIRLLALGLLIVLGIGTPVLIYTSEGGALNIMKEKAVATGQAQQDRLKQAP